MMCHEGSPARRAAAERTRKAIRRPTLFTATGAVPASIACKDQPQRQARARARSKDARPERNRKIMVITSHAPR